MSTQQQVAVELGYDRRRVKRVLAKHTFACAGDLVDFLEDKLDSSEEEEKEEEEKEEEKEGKEEKEGTSSRIIIGAEAVVNSETYSLREETEALYRRTLCKRCVSRCATNLCLPCCHISLCNACIHARKCPMCDSFISNTIVTYLV